MTVPGPVLGVSGTRKCGAGEATKTVWVSEHARNVFAEFEVKSPTRLELVIKSNRDMQKKSKLVENNADFWGQIKGDAREHVWRTKGLARPDETYYARIAGRWKRGGGEGGTAPTYRLKARMATVKIDKCRHSNTAFQEKFKPNGLARRPGGSMDFTYTATPAAITNTTSETGVPDPWKYKHAFTIVVGTIHTWNLTVKYTGPNGETATHSKPCI